MSRASAVRTRIHVLRPPQEILFRENNNIYWRLQTIFPPDEVTQLTKLQTNYSSNMSIFQSNSRLFI